MVELVKQVHLQKDGGAGIYQLHTHLSEDKEAQWELTSCYAQSDEQECCQERGEAVHGFELRASLRLEFDGT